MSEILSLNVTTEDQVPVKFNVPNSFTWSGDVTISIFLRDWLRQFNTVNNCVPPEYTEKYANLDLTYFSEDIEALASQFDYIAIRSVFDRKAELQPYIDTAFAKLAKLYHYLWW